MKLLNILIVEDDSLIGMLLADLLTGLGHRVCAVERTEIGAVIAAARFQPNLMIVDAHLTDGSGLSAVDTILRQQYIPYVFVTGDKYGIQKQAPSAIVIEKPFRERELLEAMERAMLNQ